MPHPGYITINIPEEYSREIDKLVKDKKFKSRDEFVRKATKALLADHVLKI